MRRWNGWGDEAVESRLAPAAVDLLASLVGPGGAGRDASLDEALRGIPPSRLAGEAGMDTAPEARLRHARGQSLPDWIALRAGRVGPVPDAIATPATTAEVRGLLDRATAGRWEVIPYGGGTSVVGGVTPTTTDRPIVSIDLAMLAGLRQLDASSGLATFGAGTLGPAIETALGTSGRTLGHYPQSFELSSLGGWVATRSAGQESIGYGRIEALFAGGHVETPAGPLDLPTYPASAAGPDVRELVLGSEGRLGILTDVIVRTVRRPPRDQVRAYSVPDWDHALALARSLAASGLDLAMVRASTPLETASTLAMAGDARAVGWLRRYLRLRHQSPEPCLVLVGLHGPDRVVTATEGEVIRLVRAAHGVGLPGVANAWRRERFTTPYLRNALWDAGYAVDTLETAADWSVVPPLAGALGPALRHGLEADGERVHAFSHLSHVYPSGSSLYTTYVFRRSSDPDETLARWRRLKATASETIVAHGGTISHQHGVGVDHARYLEREKGGLALSALRAAFGRFDPDGVMHRGVLFDDLAGPWTATRS